MNPFKYYHSVVSLPASLEDKLDAMTANGVFTKATSHTADPSVPDGFFPNGKPAVDLPEFLYPCYAPIYLGIPYPSTLAAVPEKYSRTAAIAALEWLEKTLDHAKVNRKHFDAELLCLPIDGQEFRFAFPNTVIHYVDTDPKYADVKRDRYASVVVVADVSDNNSDWDDGTLPYYAESQARFLLWCWDMKCGHLDICPTDCFVVRITGNTPGDVTVRVVHGDPQKDTMIIKRICKRIAGKPVSSVAGTIRDQGTWFERKAKERENAYQIQDPDIYYLVRSYMETKTSRKELEAESSKIKSQMDALAIRLASQIETDKQFGLVRDTGGKREYTVSHQPRRSQPVTVNPPLIRQYFPEYADLIQVHEVPRGVISIEAE